MLICLLSGYAKASPTILVVGDSLSAAYNIPEDSGWVNLLESKLKETLPDVRVINSSYSGDTSRQGLERLPKLLQTYSPDVVMIELGGNDGLRGLPLIHIQKNLQKMIRLAQEQGSEVILIGVHIPPNYGPRYQQRFFEIYAKLAQSMNTKRVPFLLEGVALNPKLMQPDGIHPTESAQPIILQTVWPVLEEALKNLLEAGASPA